MFDDEMPPELLALLMKFVSSDDLYFLRLCSRSVFRAASREFIRRVKYFLLDERRPRDFTTAVWTIRGHGSRRGRVDAPLGPFSVGRLLREVGLRTDSLVTSSVIELLAVESFEVRGELLAGLGATKSELVLFLGNLLRFQSTAELEGNELCPLLRGTRLPITDLVDVVQKLEKAFQFIWDAISSLEDWEGDLSLEKAVRTVSISGLMRMYADALVEAGDEDGALDLFGAFFDSWDKVGATKAISHTAFSWRVRGVFFRGIFDEFEGGFETVLECWRILFGNGYRDPSLTSGDCSAFVGIHSGGTVLTVSCLFEDIFWGQPEVFQAQDFLNGVVWSVKGITELLQSLLSEEGTNPTRIASFFRTNLLQHKTQVVDFFCKHPELAGTEKATAILKALGVGLDEFARIVLARYVKLSGSGGDVQSMLDPVSLYLGAPSYDPVKLGYLLASIFSLCYPVEGRTNTAWTLERVREITKHAVDMFGRRAKDLDTEGFNRAYSDFLSMARAVFEMLATFPGNPHVKLGLVLARSGLCGLPNAIIPQLFGHSADIRELFRTRREILFFHLGFLAPDSTHLHSLKSDPTLVASSVYTGNELSQRLPEMDRLRMLVFELPELNIKLNATGAYECVALRMEDLPELVA